MSTSKSPFVVLMADDDEDDRLLASEALLESESRYEMRFVKDGVELMQYLRREGDFRQQADVVRPNLILLDLNMPRKDGREALAEIKSDPDLGQIPVIILTTSSTHKDIFQSNSLGAASYRTKPVTFKAMVDFMKALGSLFYESRNKGESASQGFSLSNESGFHKT